MLKTMNLLLGKWMPILTPLSVLIGVFAEGYLHSFVFIVPALFAFMTFTGSLNSNFRMLAQTAAHPLPIFLALAVLHVAAPLWASAAGHIVFPDDPLTITGFILALSIPTGITSVLWVTLYKGNVSLALVIILIDTLLSPVVVPFTMLLLSGSHVELDIKTMMADLVWMIVLPSLIGMCVNQWMRQEKASRLHQVLSPFSKLSLPLVIAINSAVIAPHLKTVDAKFIQIIVVIFFVVLSGYFFAFLIGVLTRQPRENVVTLLYTGGMRNISAGAVIAVNFFPPQAAVPVVVCMLFQQILAALHGHALTKFYRAD